MSGGTPLLALALQSLRNRLATALLISATLAVSVALMLAIQLLRTAGRESFSSALSGTDLIVGARTGDVNLLLLSVFRIGDASANLSWDSYRKLASHRDVSWTIPISLGDMHRGFRVLGTTGEYFRHYRYNDGRVLRFAAGGPFQEAFDAVVGAEVAASLHYRPGATITLSHGTGAVSFLEHDEQPLRVAGVLARTGTPVDRTVHVTLDAIAALHAAAGSGGTTPDGITALLVGMKSRAMTLTMQRAVNAYRAEPLTAILPRASLEQLWSLVGVADRLLLIVSGFVVLASLLGMMTSLLAGLNDRRREMALLRAIGARPRQIFALLMVEAGVLACAGILCGVLLGFGTLLAARPLIAARFGIEIGLHAPGGVALWTLGGIVLASLAAGAIPAWRAYASSLGDGLQLRT